MRRRLLIVLALAVVAGAVWWSRPEPTTTFPVVGDLSDQEVTEIRMAVRTYMKPPILPNLSLASLLAAPKVIRQRIATKIPEIERIEVRNRVFVVVYSGPVEKDDQGKDKLWCVFRTPKGWKVNGVYGRLDSTRRPAASRGGG